MQTKVQKWGNSLRVRIPKALAEEAGVEAGAEVDIDVSNGDLVVRPRRRKRYRLADLLRRVTATMFTGRSTRAIPSGARANRDYS